MEYVQTLLTNWPAMILIAVIWIAASIIGYCRYSHYLSAIDPYSLIASMIILALIILIILNSCKAEVATPTIASAAAAISHSFRTVP